MSEEKSIVPTEPKADAPAPTKADQAMALMNMDVSLLTKEQQAQYLAAYAQMRGLNPMSKPFDLIPGRNGKQIIYANAGAADQIADMRKLSRHLVYAGPLCALYEDSVGRLQADRATILDPNQFITVWRVVEMIPAEGGSYPRVTYDVGCNYWKDAEGDGKTNLIMRTFTKGDRRAVLGHGGIGLPDASELDTIPTLMPQGPKVVAPPQPKAALEPPAVVPSSVTRTVTPEIVAPEAPRQAAPPANGNPPVPKKPLPPPVPPKR